MNDNERRQIYNSLNLKETDELIEIWKKHDTNEWIESAFEVVKEILQERQVELPPIEKPKYQHPEIDEMVDIYEVERKIKDNEGLLLRAKNICSGMKAMYLLTFFLICRLYSPSLWLFILSALLLLGLNSWLLYREEKQKGEIECVLRELNDKKGKLKAILDVNE